MSDLTRALPPAEVFRRRRFAAPHRQPGLVVRLLRPFLAALALVGSLAAVAYWVLFTPAFRLREVRVEGVERVSGAWAGEVLSVLHGRHLLGLRLSHVESRLRRQPWVRDVEIRRVLPDRLMVVIEERQPAALLRRGEHLFYVDYEGRVIDAYDPRLGGAGLLQLCAAPETEPEVADALSLAEALERLRPEWAARLSEIEVLGDGDFRIYTAALPFPLVLSLEGVEPALARLDRLLPEILRRYPDLGSLDLRFAGRIVLQPAASPPVTRG